MIRSVNKESSFVFFLCGMTDYLDCSFCQDSNSSFERCLFFFLCPAVAWLQHSLEVPTLPVWLAPNYKKIHVEVLAMVLSFL